MLVPLEKIAQRLKELKPNGENKFAPTAAKQQAKGRLDQWEETVKGMAELAVGEEQREAFLKAAGL